jgi:POT family proton-dependent oligopeptide transporter
LDDKNGSCHVQESSQGLAGPLFYRNVERFGFYLLLGIFVLYMTDTAKGGLGFSTVKAMDI